MNKELQEILVYLEEATGTDRRTVLATVVDVNGSSYRQPGARMLITEGSWTSVGTVSGGCLERDVVERAARVLKTGRSELITYDTAATDGSVFSLNMGCKGVIKILLERPAKEFTDFLKQRLQRGLPGMIATLIAKNGVNDKDDSPIGARILLDERRGVIAFSNFTEAAIETLLPDCLAVLKERKSEMLATPFGEVFMEYVAAPTHLAIFGAGADAVSLVTFAKNVGWRVTVIDHRPAFATSERFPGADEIILSRPENLDDNFFPDENTAVVVMTHNYEHDREILKFLLNSEAVYIGALGPKRRTVGILNELNEDDEGSDWFSPERLTKLYAPIGLDIGGDTPEVIAISIIAEIQSVIKNRNGGFLRQRKGSINGQDVSEFLQNRLDKTAEESLTYCALGEANPNFEATRINAAR